MGNIKVTRVDNRYIHGQVNARLVREYRITRVLLISDAVKKDLFMTQLYKSIAIGYQVDILGLKEASDAYNSGKYAKDNIMLLWGNVPDAFETFQDGLKYSELVLGNMPADSGKKQVDKTCYMNKEEAEKLKMLEAAGVDVYFQAMPDTQKTTLKDALHKTGF
ncbi:MAG TPA: PTS sugar transporter subunit IIB [Lachnospiraceae bacterium]|nr:PTS sugar transporter subunit IIB [Lachnospiraceae bacterium]